jgi:isopropylmalate/homocitrate/citramalate synthase
LRIISEEISRMVLPREMNEKEIQELHPWYKPGKWFTSPATWFPEVRAMTPNLPKKVHIQETSLREGEENVSVSFTIDQKVEIARRLSAMGVRAIDCGYVGNPYQEDTVKRIISGGVIRKPTKVLLNRMCGDLHKQLDVVKKAADHAVEVGCTAFGPVCLIVPQTGKEQAAYVELIRYIKDNHPDLNISFGITMASGSYRVLKNLSGMREYHNLQLELARLVTEAGVDRISIADTMGCASPSAWKYIVSNFRKAIGPEKGLTCHNHNDFGLAVGNAVAGIEGGADWLDVVICGLGDRAGNTSFEEVVLTLEAIYGISTGIKLEKLYDLAQYVQEASGARTQHWKAVVGDRVWAESSHAAGLIELKREGKSFFEAGMEAWNPEIVGQTHQLFFGKVVINPSVIEGFLKYLGLKYDNGIIDNIIKAGLQEIDKRAALGQDRWLTEEEVNALCRKMAR